MDLVYNYKIFVFLKYLIIFQSVISKVLAKETHDYVRFGKCCKMRTDIIYIVGTYGMCAGLCKERPVCKAYSYHRLSWFCRLHTEDCLLESCLGFLYSNKEEFTMTNFDTCPCQNGQVCVKEEGSTGFTCEIRECNSPSEPADGKTLGNDYRLGRHIRYSCDVEFVPEGNAVRECLGNGTWSGGEFSCNPVCPVAGSLEWGQSLYYIEDDVSLKKNFTDASAYCTMCNGHVIHVNSQNEHDFITGTIGQPDNPVSERYWVGIKRNTTNDIWYFSGSTTQITFNAWMPGQPAAGRNCAIYRFDTTSSTWQWLAESCEFNQGFPLCEYDI